MTGTYFYSIAGHFNKSTQLDGGNSSSTRMSSKKYTVPCIPGGALCPSLLLLCPDHRAPNWLWSRLLIYWVLQPGIQSCPLLIVNYPISRVVGGQIPIPFGWTISLSRIQNNDTQPMMETIPVVLKEQSGFFSGIYASSVAYVWVLLVRYVWLDPISCFPEMVQDSWDNLHGTT